jgi:hypothetical protein
MEEILNSSQVSCRRLKQYSVTSMVGSIEKSKKVSFGVNLTSSFHFISHLTRYKFLEDVLSCPPRTTIPLY